MIIGLVALVKSAVSGTTGNVMPIPAPVDLSLYPLATYQVVSHIPGYSLDGPTGVTTERVVFECLGTTYASARTLAEAIANALRGYRGTLSDGTQVFEMALANMLDRWDDGSKVSCTAVHVLITYSD